jgi:hypothetical protein
MLVSDLVDRLKWAPPGTKVYVYRVDYGDLVEPENVDIEDVVVHHPAPDGHDSGRPAWVELHTGA